MCEGVVQGALGAALALLCLWFAFEGLRPYLEDGLSLVFAAGSITFFDLRMSALALAFGASLGFLGSRAAVARYVEV